MLIRFERQKKRLKESRKYHWTNDHIGLLGHIGAQKRQWTDYFSKKFGCCTHITIRRIVRMICTDHSGQDVRHMECRRTTSFEQTRWRFFSLAKRFEIFDDQIKKWARHLLITNSHLSELKSKIYFFITWSSDISSLGNLEDVKEQVFFDALITVKLANFPYDSQAFQDISLTKKSLKEDPKEASHFALRSTLSPSFYSEEK